MSADVPGYKYNNPEQGELGIFRVTRAAATKEWRNYYLARSYQGVMHMAMDAQFGDQLTEAQLDSIADPNDPEAIQSQYDRLIASQQTDDPPSYFHADVLAPNQVGLSVVSFGKTQWADGRSRSLRFIERDAQKAKNLADIGNIYTLPSHPLSGVRLQRRGYGSAILHSMLDDYPNDIPVIFYEAPDLNTKIVPLAEKYDFIEEAARSNTLGCVAITQVLYKGVAGMTVGDLRENLEKRRLWLTEREPIIS